MLLTLNGSFMLRLVLLVVSSCDCLYSKWLKNTDLNSPYNWNAGRLPCGNDRLTIPDESPVVFYQLNTTIQELVSPYNFFVLRIAQLDLRSQIKLQSIVFTMVFLNTSTRKKIKTLSVNQVHVKEVWN